MEINERIRTVRKIKNMGQLAIAKELNVTVQSYSLKENGKRPITTKELEIISETLGVSASIFFDKDFNVKFKSIKDVS